MFLFFYKWTPVVSLLVAYTLFSLDALSDELERPFDDLDNTLLINSIANIIERDICAALDKPLPNLVVPINHILKW